MKISENKLRKLIRESIEEKIDWGNTHDHYLKARNIKYDKSFNEWYDIKTGMEEILCALRMYMISYGDDTQAKKWYPILEKFLEYAERKDGQMERIEKMDNDIFASQHNGMDYHQYGNQMDNRYDEWMKEHPEDEYGEGFEDSLSDDDKKFKNDIW